MITCVYHPIYRSCRNCGRDLNRDQVRPCVAMPNSLAEEVVSTVRTSTLQIVRAMIQSNAQSTWKAGLTERSDALTDLLVEFDARFPEARER